MRRYKLVLAISLLGYPAVSLATPPPPNAMRWSAEMPEEPLKIGETYRIDIKVTVNDQLGLRHYGAHPNAAFVVQIDAPECVRPSVDDPMRPWDTPFERAVMDGIARFDFKLVSKPKPGDMLAFNLCGFVELAREKRVTDAQGTRVESTSNQWFIRERGNLLLERGAELRLTDANRSRWGDNDDRLQIENEIEPFTLPDMTGKMHDLRDYLGRYYLVLAFYRSHEENVCVVSMAGLHLRYEDFDRLGAKVICISKEDESLEAFGKLVSRFRPVPPRTLFLWDQYGRETRDYAPVTFYVVDLDGRIREIIPATRMTRAPTQAILNVLAEIIKQDGVAPPGIAPRKEDDAAQSQPATSGS